MPYVKFPRVEKPRTARHPGLTPPQLLRDRWLDEEEGLYDEWCEAEKESEEADALLEQLQAVREKLGGQAPERDDLD